MRSRDIHNVCVTAPGLRVCYFNKEPSAVYNYVIKSLHHGFFTGEILRCGERSKNLLGWDPGIITFEYNICMGRDGSGFHTLSRSTELVLCGFEGACELKTCCSSLQSVSGYDGYARGKQTLTLPLVKRLNISGRLLIGHKRNCLN